MKEEKLKLELGATGTDGITTEIGGAKINITGEGSLLFERGV